MFKYIYIILGILLFILIHNIENFSIGIVGEGNICNDIDLICDEQLKCIDGKCEQVLAGGGRVDDIEKININILQHQVENKCMTNTKCTLNESVIEFKDACHPQCHEAENIPECNNYHTLKLCNQACVLTEEQNKEKNLKKDGFEKINKLVNINEDEYFLKFKELLNAPFLSRSKMNMSYNMKYKNISFSEYLLKNYMNKKLNANIKILDHGIFYINRQIIYFKYARYVQTRISEKGSNKKKISSDFNIYYNNYSNTKLFEHYPFLHIDGQNVRPYEILESDPFFHLKSDTFFSKKTFKCNNLLSDDPNPDIEYNTYLQRIAKNNMNGINGIEYDNDTVFINIWLLFYGTRNVETLGFIDAIDDNKPHLYDDTLVEMLQDNEDVDKLTSFITEPAQYTNIYNAKTKNITSDDSKPDIDLEKLYTFNMEQGDALVFRTDIPHVGFPPSDPNGLRMSLEARYAYLVKPFSIETMFDVHDSPESSTSDPILYLQDPNTFNNVVPEELRDIVYNYFNNEFKLFAKIYNILFTEPLNNIYLFTKFIDYIPYDDYYFNMSDSDKELAIGIFLENSVRNSIRY